MPNFVKRNDNGPPPPEPREGTPVDNALDAAAMESLSRDEILRRQAQISNEMRDDLELIDARREKTRGVGLHTTKAPWLVGK